MPSDLVIRGGTVHDGTGEPGRRADVAIAGDRIVHVGELPADLDGEVIDATGLAVTPGFINVLSHAWGSLQVEPSGASDVLQGVTTEVFGEAFSLGPGGPELAEAVRQFDLDEGARVDFDRLSDGLSTLERNGIAPNVASFVGGHNLRILGAGFDDGPMDGAALDRVRGVLAEEMQDGALGIGTALIYAPGNYASTDELVALCETVAEYDGMYISHMRSEGEQFLECLEELITIGARTGARAEVYHLKAAGRANWPKMKLAIERIEQARADGQVVTADMYPYTAGGTALAASIPPAFHVGGPEALLERVRDPRERARMAAMMGEPSDEWENLLQAAGGGTGVLFFEDLSDGTPARGRRLSDLAGDLGLDDVEALLEIVAREPNCGVAYFIIDEDNVRLGLRQPWVSVGSDAPAHPAVTPWIDSATHPRTYGTFARVLGRYCRDEGLFSFAEAVRRMTSLPAENLGLRDRGVLRPGAFADVVVLDPATVQDHATFEEPHQYATGVRDVVVNGAAVLRAGALTGATPGRRLCRER